MKLQSLATKKPAKAVELLSIRLVDPFLSEVWKPLLAQLPKLSASDIVKQAIQARAAMEAEDEEGNKVSVKLFYSDMPEGVEFSEFLGFSEESSELRGRQPRKGKMVRKLKTK